MTRYVLIALLWVGCGGCYREPSNPAQVRQNAESRGESAEPVMPSDSVPSGLADTGDATSESRAVDIGTHYLTAPEPWVRKQLTHPFLLAEFVLPKSEGDTDDGRLTVATAGGTVEENLVRWKKQFGGTPQSESQETIEVGGVKMTLVDYTGTFTDQRGPAVPAAAPKAGYRMLGAIIPLGEQLFFVKGYGPAKTVAAYADQVRAFLDSLQPKSDAESTSAGGTSSERP